MPHELTQHLTQLQSETTRSGARSKQTLEATLAEAERMLSDQNAELETAFARLESLGSSPIHVEERELTALASNQLVPTPWHSPTLAIATRC